MRVEQGDIIRIPDIKLEVIIREIMPKLLFFQVRSAKLSHPRYVKMGESTDIEQDISMTYQGESNIEITSSYFTQQWRGGLIVNDNSCH